MIREAGSEPRHHTQTMQERLEEIMDHLWEGLDKVDGPKLKAFIRTATQAFGGLNKAFTDYGRKRASAGSG